MNALEHAQRRTVSPTAPGFCETEARLPGDTSHDHLSASVGPEVAQRALASATCDMVWCAERAGSLELHAHVAFLAPPRRGLPPPPDAGGRPPSPPGPTRSARTRRATARTARARRACGLNLPGARRSLRAKLAGYSGRQLGHGLDTPDGSGGCARWACLSASRAWRAAAIAIV